MKRLTFQSNTDHELCKEGKPPLKKHFHLARLLLLLSDSTLLLPEAVWIKWEDPPAHTFSTKFFCFVGYAQRIWKCPP